MVKFEKVILSLLIACVISLLTACTPASTAPLFTVTSEATALQVTKTPTPTASFTVTFTPVPLSSSPTLTPAPTLVPLSSCPDLLPSRLELGGYGIVNIDPPGLNNVRKQPDRTWEKTGELPAGSIFRVLGGEQCANGSSWFQVETLDKSLTGWTVEADSTRYSVSPIENSSIYFLVEEPAKKQFVIKQAKVEEGTVSTTGSISVADILPGVNVKPSPDENTIALFNTVEPRLLLSDLSGNVHEIHLKSKIGDYGIFWSPDSTKILAGSEIMDTQGNRVREIPPGSYLGCSWAGDNSAVACTRFRSATDATTEIFVISLDGKDYSLTTNASISEDGASFSPDGSQIAFRQLPDTIMVANRDGSNPIEIDKGRGAWGAVAWSTQGDQIAYGCGALCVANLKTGKTQDFLRGAYDQAEFQVLRWSPDGKRLTFVLTNPGGVNLRYVYFNGRVSNISMPAANQILWSPESMRLVYVTLKGVYTINALGTAQTTLAEAGNITLLAWLPR